MISKLFRQKSLYFYFFDYLYLLSVVFGYMLGLKNVKYDYLLKRVAKGIIVD